MSRLLNAKDNGDIAFINYGHILETAQMTTYRTASAWTSDPSQLSKKQVGYYRARLKNRVHQLVLEQFLKLEDGGLSRAELARRIYKRPEIITRLLGSPGNWTLDTLSDLMLAMGYEPALSVYNLAHETPKAAEESEQLPRLGESKKLEGEDIGLFLARRPPDKDEEVLFLLAPYQGHSATGPNDKTKTGTFG
jgi:hypothetical protein